MNNGLTEMFLYNAWANRELFNACRTLNNDQLDRQVKGISGTVRGLLMHIAGGQQTFILRTKGRQHEGYELGWHSDWPGIDAVIEIITDTSQELIAIAEQLQEDEVVDLSFQGKTYRFPKRFFLVHAVEHSAEHRTEVKVALAHMDIETPDLDGWNYAQSAGHGQEVPGTA
jgi:uncharacterized damage-inducible protein DinB